MVPCSSLGGERGERTIAATPGTNIIPGAVNNSDILLPYCPSRSILAAKRKGQDRGMWAHYNLFVETPWSLRVINAD